MDSQENTANELSTTGRIEAIWIKRRRRGPMDQRDEVTLVAGKGIEGNTEQGGRRQVTLIERERWEEAVAELGADAAVRPEARRANFLLAGVALEETRGRRLRLGECLLEIGGETTPCERMDEACQGLREALRPGWRGGVFARVVEGGVVRRGDPVAWVEDA